jgi:hypothetical protein
MSEKHLTEPAWKAVVLKTPVKDTGLQKALVAYARVDAAKDRAQALGALEEIGTQAVKLKRANPGLKEVTAYLDEVVKEVNKTKPGLTASAKPQEPKTEAKAEPKEEPDGTDLKERLISALKKVKAGDGQDSLRFVACVAKPCFGVLLAKSASDKIGVAHKRELSELTKGTRFIEGNCVFEKNAHTFVVGTVPAGLAKNLKKALKEYTGLTYKVRVRDLEGKVVADGDTDVDPEEVTAAEIPARAPAVPGAPTATSGEEMVKFTARFKALQPELVKAIASKAPHGEEAKQRAVEAGTMANKKDFAKANQLLEMVESLLRRTAVPPAPAPGADGAFQKAWAAATANLQEAVDTIRNQLAAFATALMASGEENLIWIAEEGLSQVFSSLRDAALTIDRATSKLPSRVVVKARPAIETLKKHITSPRVLACDQNNLGVTVTIQKTISKAIQELETALELAKA